MVREKYGVRLTPEQRNQLEHLVRAGKSTARVTTRARILLKTDAAWSAPQVAQALDVAEGTVFRIKRRFAEEGLAGALPDRPQAHRYRKLEDRGEVHPVSSTGQALYHEAYDPERPVVCFDETSKQLLGDVRPPIEAAPGRVERYATEYQRNGTRNRFMFCEPKGGWRHVEVTGRRTAVDFAEQMKWLVDQAYPDATVIRLVLDNLNTHKPGSLYEAFAPSEARRIAKRLEFHHTPNHGSWLNPVLSLPKGWLKSS